MAKLRTLQHLRTTLAQYVEIDRNKLGDLTQIPSYNSVPSSQDILNITEPAPYIFIESEDKYYVLQGKNQIQIYWIMVK